MPEDRPIEGDNLAEEFRNLGKNLFGALQAAWESPERKRLQDEFINDMSELGATLKREAESFSQSPAGQQMKADVDELGERFRTGQAQEQMRKELIDILRSANTELGKVINRWSADNSPSDDSPDNRPEA